jgi:hypothetical protein
MHGAFISCLCLRILGLTELLDLAIILLNLERHLYDLFEYRTKHLCWS